MIKDTFKSMSISTMGNMMLTLSVARCLETILIIDLRWYDCRVDPPAYSEINISLIKYISFKFAGQRSFLYLKYWTFQLSKQNHSVLKFWGTYLSVLANFWHAFEFETFEGFILTQQALGSMQLLFPFVLFLLGVVKKHTSF